MSGAAAAAAACARPRLDLAIIPPRPPAPPAPPPRRSTLPKPLAADFQCAAAASPHVLLAVGGAERSGLFTRQRPIWQYDARQAAEAGGDGWTRVG